MKIGGIVIAIALATYLGISAYGATIAMKIPRIPLGDTPASVGLAYTDVSFASRTDSVVLKGWHIPGEKTFTIIMVNGGWQNRVDPNVGTLELSRDLVERGYSVLLFDLRGRGESGGEGITFAYVERDIGGAVDYIRSTGCHTDSIGIIGFSSGAVSLLFFAGQESIGGLVLDGCFIDMNKMIVTEVAKRGVPEFIVRSFLPGVFLMAKIVYGYNAINPVDWIGDVTCPILFIHGEMDSGVPEADIHKLYYGGDNPSNRLWVVGGADHCQVYKTNCTGYVDEIDSFFGSLSGMQSLRWSQSPEADNRGMANQATEQSLTLDISSTILGKNKAAMGADSSPSMSKNAQSIILNWPNTHLRKNDEYIPLNAMLIKIEEAIR